MCICKYSDILSTYRLRGINPCILLTNKFEITFNNDISEEILKHNNMSPDRSYLILDFNKLKGILYTKYVHN